MKRSLIIILLAICVFGMKAQLTADWKVHLPYDAWPVKVVETPERVYTLNRTFQYNANLTGRDFNSMSLHYYDKEGDEYLQINQRTNASDNIVADIQYNPVKKYLLVVYSNCNIDFIYDDGRVENVPALEITSIQGKKEVNSISFDFDNNLVYLATSFGYITLNDKNHEVAESRNYGQPVQSINRCGDRIVLTSGNQIYFAPVKEKRFNMEDYYVMEEAPSVDKIFPMNGSKFYAISSGLGGNLYVVDPDAKTYELKIDDANILDVQPMTDGYMYLGNVRIGKLDMDGGNKMSNRPNDLYGKIVGSRDFNKYWVLQERKGLGCYTSNNGTWQLTKDYMRPNSPATYLASSMAYHPTYGMLVGSNGPDLAYTELNQATPNNISALNNSFWKEYSPIYTNPDAIPVGNNINYFGLAVDPSAQNYVYRGSVTNGMLRINLADPTDYLIMANPSSRNKDNARFVKIAEDIAAWNALCRFTEPQFSSDGTLWSLFNDTDTKTARLYYWKKEDRLASTSPQSFRQPQYMELPSVFTSSNSDVMLKLNAPKNKNMAIIGGYANGSSVLLYDTNGTPETTVDDRYVYLTTPYDQDGGSVNFLALNNFYEDPQTGLVWILSQRGVFTINPATIFDNPNVVNRIKVSRNDGTNLADYLLNEINVNHLAVDGEGRKWFSTSNGLVCTAADGKKILAEFTSDNSYLPSDNVFHTCYNPQNNSMMVSTENGLVEMFPSGSGSSTSTTAESVRVYPNPVEPDFYGYVRIDNVTDGSLVKITDSQGGIVKELGPVSGGAVEWDVTGMNNNRVSTGVYYILVSPGAAGGSSSVNKILVLN